MPLAFDVPLAPHHRLLGRWAAARAESSAVFTRQEARAQIQIQFEAAALAILEPLELADFHVEVLIGDDDLPPALGLVCDSIGSIDLGWIEKTNVLANTVFGSSAPLGWRAAVYKALSETLSYALPIFGFGELLEEMSMYYWDGATDDAGARAAMIDMYGTDPEDLDDEMLPSGMMANRPDYMLSENVDPLKRLPVSLRKMLRALRDKHKALKDFGPEFNAWRFDWDHVSSYMSWLEDASHLPPLTLVPFDQFQRELDAVCRPGMECGFTNVAGLCQLPDASRVDDWFASLQLGVDFLLAAQALITLDPKKL